MSIVVYTITKHAMKKNNFGDGIEVQTLRDDTRPCISSLTYSGVIKNVLYLNVDEPLHMQNVRSSDYYYSVGLKYQIFTPNATTSMDVVGIVQPIFSRPNDSYVTEKCVVDEPKLPRQLRSTYEKYNPQLELKFWYVFVSTSTYNGSFRVACQEKALIAQFSFPAAIVLAAGFAGLVKLRYHRM